MFKPDQFLARIALAIHEAAKARKPHLIMGRKKKDAVEIIDEVEEAIEPLKRTGQALSPGKGAKGDGKPTKPTPTPRLGEPVAF